MEKTIGVVLSDRVTAGLVTAESPRTHRIDGVLRSYPES